MSPEQFVQIIKVKLDGLQLLYSLLQSYTLLVIESSMHMQASHLQTEHSIVVVTRTRSKIIYSSLSLLPIAAWWTAASVRACFFSFFFHRELP